MGDHALTVQRFVARYRDRGRSYWDAFVSDWEARTGRAYGQTGEEVHTHHLRNIAGRYEKEGGGLTSDLQEAKLIGWRSKRFLDRDRQDVDLIPAAIVL